ncbi:hypothetical protein SAMN05444141_106129 [Pseudovibrio denitrificans]|uniref:Sel1 repeat-containing protein n=1 Tax=Pseudovibrio denitrificans TaxID=258256 RepID=A0A1I7CLW0_9HYPH|nr:hypothetical protein [Pseudovibrio denitrificans]SFU00393.1 hypothetical protein SAMN05444141_106129 [Pseudovibrio denitrificans]
MISRSIRFLVLALSLSLIPTIAFSQATHPKAPDVSYEEAVSLLNAERYEEALPAFMALAEAGNPQAARQLSKMFKLGLGASEDVNSAIDWGIKAQKLEGKGIIDAYASLFLENVGLDTEFNEYLLVDHFKDHILKLPDFEQPTQRKQWERNYEEIAAYKFNIEHFQGSAHDFYVVLVLRSFHFTAEQILDVSELTYQFRTPSYQAFYERILLFIKNNNERIEVLEGIPEENRFQKYRDELSWLKESVQPYNTRLNQGLLSTLSREMSLERYAKNGNATAQWELGKGIFLGKPFPKDELCGLKWMTVAILEGGGDWAEFEEYTQMRPDIMLPMIILRAQRAIASDYRRSVCAEQMSFKTIVMQ